MKKAILLLLILTVSCTKENPFFNVGDKVFINRIVVAGNTADNLQKFKKLLIEEADEAADMAYYGLGSFLVTGDCVEVTETIGSNILRVVDYDPMINEYGERQYYVYAVDLYKSAKKIK